MEYTINVDTGGTFTDGFFTRGEEFKRVKVETTPHDLTVCFRNCIEEGARSLGLDSMEELLLNTKVARFSTTLATNTIIQKNGPKLGLVVTRGHEDDLYGEAGRGDGIPVAAILPAHMVIGVAGESGDDGGVVEPEVEEVRAAVRRLLTSGARAIVVSLRGSFFNPLPEKKIKEIILGDYPKHLLGSVPVFLSSELCTRSGDYERTNAAVLNAYLHRELVKYLYKAEEDLRQSNLCNPMLVVHSTGGAARVAKTTALHTYNSGPVSGFLGSFYVAKLYGLENVVSVDMGGTSADIGIIAGREYAYNFRPEIERIPINLPMLEIKAMGGGGGSIARIDSSGGGVAVGPESAGAMPGPACYGLGGRKPTVTDADLVLGYLNPRKFLGGMRELDRDKAVTAVGESIADPLGISVEEAAFAIKERLESNVLKALRDEVAGKGLSAGDFTMFVYGGAGATHCCGFGRDFGTMLTFPYSAVFSAFGASTLDVIHVYERFMPLDLVDGSGAYASDYDRFNQAVEEMRDSAQRDMRGEGLDAERVVFSLELQAGYKEQPGGPCVMVRPPRIFLESEEDVRGLCASFQSGYLAIDGEGAHCGEVGIQVKVLRLVASFPVEYVDFPVCETRGEDPTAALEDERKVFWGGSFVDTRVYDRKLLECGNVVTGPAIIEADDTTYVIPQGRKFTIDRYLNGVIDDAR
ncbi:MAG: hydantoinase/oxoprolinase family protein [Actinobacteria bacterium]|jgi:N-methylhydantoinase A/acetophenone carboxylase|nr:MAG: hydantoinase/oxoprolinase family protein [Actinomycetota bacterium]